MLVSAVLGDVLKLLIFLLGPKVSRIEFNDLHKVPIVHIFKNLSPLELRILYK